MSMTISKLIQATAHAISMNSPLPSDEPPIIVEVQNENQEEEIEEPGGM